MPRDQQAFTTLLTKGSRISVASRTRAGNVPNGNHNGQVLMTFSRSIGATTRWPTSMMEYGAHRRPGSGRCPPHNCRRGAERAGSLEQAALAGGRSGPRGTASDAHQERASLIH